MININTINNYSDIPEYLRPYVYVNINIAIKIADEIQQKIEMMENKIKNETDVNMVSVYQEFIDVWNKELNHLNQSVQQDEFASDDLCGGREFVIDLPRFYSALANDNYQQIDTLNELIDSKNTTKEQKKLIRKEIKQLKKFANACIAKASNGLPTQKEILNNLIGK